MCHLKCLELNIFDDFNKSLDMTKYFDLFSLAALDAILRNILHKYNACLQKDIEIDHYRINLTATSM